MSNKERNVELIQTMDSLIESFVNSLAIASLKLNEYYESENGRFRNHPIKYTIPRMSIDMKLTIVVENGQAKGVFKKTSSNKKEEILSTISLDIVAVPKSD